MPAGVLLGRAAELSTLTGLLEEARGGEQRVALVCGDPGIGKTTLLEALEGPAAEAGFAAVWGRCWEGAGAAPFLPWIQVLRACVRAHGDGLLTSIGEATGALGRLLPEFAAPEDPAVVDPDDDRASLFMAAADVIDAATGPGLLVALDDLHDADEGSLQLLRFLARRAVRAPLLIVGTYRVTEVARSPAHQRALSAVARHGPTIRLRGLSPDDVAVIVQRVAAPAAAAKSAEVHRATDGNPFLVYEAGRLLNASPGGMSLVDVVGHAGASLVHARLDPLPPTLREVLGAAAVLGRDFSLAVLSQLCGRAPDDVIDLMARACELHVLDPAGLGRWSFSHSLLRDEVLRQVDPGERRRLHRRAADVLQAQATGAAAVIAHHLIEGQDPRAFDSAAAAARSAMNALAFEDAAAWYERALALPSDGEPADARRYELLVELGGALLRAAEVARATDAYVRAIKAGQALGSVELADEAATRIAPYTTTDATVIGALDDALCDLPEADSSLRARVLVCFAQVLRSSSVDRTVLQRVSRQGLEMARRLGDPATLATVLEQWHLNVARILSAEQRMERLEVSEELVRLAEAAGGDPHRVLQARLARADDLLSTGQPDVAQVEAQDCLRLAREHRRPLTERQALLLLFETRWFAGDIAGAEEALRTLQDGVAVADEDRAEPELARVRISLRRWQGRFAEVELLAKESLERWPAYGLQCLTQVAQVIAVAELGRTDDARTLLEQAVGNRLVDESFGMIIPGHGWVPAPRLCCPCALIEACCLLDDRQGAEALYERLLPYGESFSREQGVCARYLGLAAALLGREDDADAHFQQAHLVSERLGARLWAAQGRLDHGRMLVGRGNPADEERAAELLTAARVAFEGMGIEVYAGRAADLLDQIRPPDRPARNSARLVEEGDYWAFHFEGRVTRLRTSKGVHYLAELLRSPGRELHAAYLAGDKSDPERARQSVTRAIKTTIQRLSEAHPPLGQHLRSTVRTGVVSTYEPDQRSPITWES